MKNKDVNDKKEIERKVLGKLATIIDPQYKKSLADLGFSMSLIDHPKDPEELLLMLKTSHKDKRHNIHLESKIREALVGLKLKNIIAIKFEYDAELAQKNITKPRLKNVKKLIAVGSGKGGVGKSTVSANLAVSLALLGYKTGVIDGDIYGPSMGKIFGINERLALGGDGKTQIYPHKTHGIKLMSFSFLLDRDQAVVWRGPMLGKAVEQFLFQVIWGELDFLIFDLPPGTGDVQMSLSQLVEVDGFIIVSTPQNLAIQDARRAAYMFKGLNVPLIGVIENMSEFHCPECGHVSHIFSKNGADALAADLGVPLLANIPLQEELMEASEKGEPIAISNKKSSITKAFEDLARDLCERLKI